MTEFETFWKLYPRKVGKAAAERAFDKAAKRKGVYDMVIVANIMAGLERLLENKPWGTDLKFCPHASTWLNGGRWEDEHTPSPKMADESTTRPCPQYLQTKTPRRVVMNGEEKAKREAREAVFDELRRQGINPYLLPVEEVRQRIANHMREGT